MIPDGSGILPQPTVDIPGQQTHTSWNSFFHSEVSSCFALILLTQHCKRSCLLLDRNFDGFEEDTLPQNVVQKT
jgi:hypothetical protein